MANEERGEIDLVTEGKTYVLRLGINAICALESRLSAAARREALDALPPEPSPVVMAKGEEPEAFVARATVARIDADRYAARRAKAEARRVTFDEVLTNVREGSMTYTIELLWAALQRYHRKQFPNLEAVGDLLDTVGGIQSVVTMATGLIDSLMRANQPPKALVDASAAEAKAGGTAADPPVAQVGIGSASSSTLVASA